MLNKAEAQCIAAISQSAQGDQDGARNAVCEAFDSLRTDKQDTPVKERISDLRTDLRTELESLLNTHSAEGPSGIPDFILAEYLMGCLGAFDKAVDLRERWYGRVREGETVDA